MQLIQPGAHAPVPLRPGIQANLATKALMLSREQLAAANALATAAAPALNVTPAQGQEFASLLTMLLGLSGDDNALMDKLLSLGPDVLAQLATPIVRNVLNYVQANTPYGTVVGEVIEKIARSPLIGVDPTQFTAVDHLITHGILPKLMKGRGIDLDHDGDIDIVQCPHCKRAFVP